MTSKQGKQANGKWNCNFAGCFCNHLVNHKYRHVQLDKREEQFGVDWLWLARWMQEQAAYRIYPSNDCQEQHRMDCAHEASF